MLYELCLELNNFFEYGKYIGNIKIVDGNVQTEFLSDEQYFRIVGSVFNDGVYKYPQTDLKDEEFYGAIWAMAVPQDVIALADEIQAWKDKYMTVDVMSPYQSESFGGYSYTKASLQSSDNGTISWQSAFANRLNQWRKLK